MLVTHMAYESICVVLFEGFNCRGVYKFFRGLLSFLSVQCCGLPVVLLIMYQQ